MKLGTTGTDHAMTFSATVARHSTNVVLDGGATRCFINQQFCKQA